MTIIKPTNIPDVGGVYMFRFKSGHFYIGSSGNLKHRIGSHIYNLKLCKKLNRNLSSFALEPDQEVVFEILSIIENDFERLNSEEQLILLHKDDPMILNHKKWVNPGNCARKQISATINKRLMSKIKSISIEKEKSFSEMVNILLTKATEGHKSKNVRVQKPVIR